MSREISFLDVTKETDSSHEAALKRANQEAKIRAAEERQRIAQIEREKQKIQHEFEKEQRKKKEEEDKARKEAEEENERLRLELQISLYREQYPDMDIEKTTERTPLTKLREIKKKVEAKNALTFMPPMLHMVGGALIKLYQKMVLEMEINPLDHEVRGLREFYMSAVSRQIMLPAWKATVAANPGLLVGGNPWYMQVMMGLYMVAESNSQRMKLLEGGGMGSWTPPEEGEEEGREAPRGPPPTVRVRADTPVHSDLREKLVQMAQERDGKGKERM